MSLIESRAATRNLQLLDIMEWTIASIIPLTRVLCAGFATLMLIRRRSVRWLILAAAFLSIVASDIISMKFPQIIIVLDSGLPIKTRAYWIVLNLQILHYLILITYCIHAALTEQEWWQKRWSTSIPGVKPHTPKSP